MTVIVTNAKSRIAYNIIRSLGKKKIKVCPADFVSGAMAFHSKYAHQGFVYPSPYRMQSEFIQCLIDRIHRWEADVLIPVYEETFLIAKHKDKISPHVKMAIPDYDQILTAHNKDRWKPIAERIGVAVPKSYSVTAIRNDPALIKELRFPVMLKPKQGGGGWAISMVRSAGQLKSLLRRKNHFGHPWQRYFLQEYIRGETHCTAMLFRQGQIRAKVSYKQLREYPPKFGQATLRVSIHSEKAESCFQRLLEELNWHGVCQADFVIDAQHQKPYLVDINPRFWGSLAQAISAGVDFPHMVYQIAKDGDVEPQKSFRPGAVSRWVGGDLMTLPSMLKNRGNRIDRLRAFFSPDSWRVYKDDFQLNDPVPFIFWTLQSIWQKAREVLADGPADSHLDGIWE